MLLNVQKHEMKEENKFKFEKLGFIGDFFKRKVLFLELVGILLKLTCHNKSPG